MQNVSNVSLLSRLPRQTFIRILRQTVAPRHGVWIISKVNQTQRKGVLLKGIIIIYFNLCLVPNTSVLPNMANGVFKHFIKKILESKSEQL